MHETPPVSGVAALIADPTRATMLSLLMDGAARTAGELARAANASPQAASNHLTQLLAGGLVKVAAQGRHRYYALSGPEVARVLEALTVLQTSPAVRAAGPRVPTELKAARSCYDHIAGELGVQITERLIGRGWLVPAADVFHLTPAGEAWFAGIGVDLPALRRGKRAFARACLDWSERRPHLAGTLGAELLRRALELGWVLRGEGRALHLTVEGQRALEQEIGLRWRQAA